MPRQKRVAAGGQIYHVVNRGVAKQRLFETELDFAAFERCLQQTLEQFPGVRLLAYCVMGNHWHLVIWPTKDGELSKFMRQLSTMHVRRWLGFREEAGTGAMYQGRFWSSMCEELGGGGHLLSLIRYVERNALRANLVKRAEDWRWSSLWQRENKAETVTLTKWPVPRPRGWVATVNEVQGPAEEQAIREAAKGDQPYGSATWVAGMRTQYKIREPKRVGRPLKTGSR